jgi:hypothetical protein
MSNPNDLWNEGVPAMYRRLSSLREPYLTHLLHEQQGLAEHNRRLDSLRYN